MSTAELTYVHEAFTTNWIAPLGPNVTNFEQEFAAVTGAPFALALSSGTAAIHLALIHLGIQPGDEVIVSSLTFSASVNPIIYCGATPIFIDSEEASWNMDPQLLAEALDSRAKENRLPKAVIVVHLYGQTAAMDEISAVCERYDIPIIEDAAEALGSTYKGHSAGTLGYAGIFSFNGNKIITTSGGGMLVSEDESFINHARKLATQARDAAPHYQHSEIGYNYRMSNVLAGIGRGQLEVLSDRVATRRRNFDFYQEALGSLPGVTMMPEASWGQTNRWLSVIQIDPALFGCDRETIRLTLEEHNIESRPVWKPMHLQPIFECYPVWNRHVAESMFDHGLCLPSGSSLTLGDLERITDIIKELSRPT